MSLRTILLSLAMIFGLSGMAWAGADQDFRLTNATGYTIDQVYVSPSNQEDWQEDVLGRDALSDGEHVNIRFSRNTSSCTWDLKVVYDDGEKAIWEDLNLCEISKITVRWNRSTGVTRAVFE